MKSSGPSDKPASTGKAENGKADGKAAVTPLKAAKPTVRSQARWSVAWAKANLLRPKGLLPRRHLLVLVFLALLPLVSILVRILAFPGVLSPEHGGAAFELLRAIGTSLNHNLSLTAIPPDHREHVLYLLYLPTGALLVALAHLTLGIRVLGFRSILIAVGFQHAGILPSLLLIAVVVATIVIVRPHLKKLQLRRYARVSVILGIVVMTMILAVLASPWLRSEVMWRAAFFPVIVLGLLAEGIARSLDRDNAVTATWRAGSTIVLAFLIAALFRWEPLREVLLQFPELLLTQVIVIILVSEYLELRLLQNWDARLAGMAVPMLFSDSKAYRVAVVRNRREANVLSRLGRSAPSKHARRSVQRIVDALRKRGHTVRVLEGDTALFSELRDFIPVHARTGQPGGIVLNLAHGIQGNERLTHVPAMLEMAGVPYTGPTPRSLILTQDVVALRTLLLHAGVPTPAFRLWSGQEEVRQLVDGLQFPIIVRPRHETSYRPRIFEDGRRLKRVVSTVAHRFQQDVVLEEIPTGREVHASILGNDVLEFLPLVEVAARKKLCPAPLEPEQAQRVRELAEKTYRLCGCRDYARIKMCLDATGEVLVLGVGSIGVFERRGSFVRAASVAGYSYEKLLARIIRIARTRLKPAATVHPLQPTAKRAAAPTAVTQTRQDLP